jgi:hypothetical protein
MDDWCLTPGAVAATPLEPVKPPLRWFFVRVRSCETQHELEAARLALRRAGRVYTADRGTEEDPAAGWFVVRSRAEDGLELRNWLENFGERVDRVQELEAPAEGRTLARQRALF